MRYAALVLIAVVFLTGLVWWALFLGNAVRSVFRRR